MRFLTTLRAGLVAVMAMASLGLVSTAAMADSGTVARGAAAGLSATDHLRAHNAYPFLQATHDLLTTGPTQTNVNDLIFVFIE